MSLPLTSTNPKDKLGIKKVPLHLNPTAGVIYMALGMWDGAIKYGPFNWRRQKVAGSVYVAAALRHIFSYIDGQDIDPDSGKPTIGHALACLAIIADAAESGNLVDDRPAPGPVPELLRTWREKDAPQEVTYIVRPRVEEGAEDGGVGEGWQACDAALPCMRHGYDHCPICTISKDA